MAILTEQITKELVIKNQPPTVHRTITYLGEKRWSIGENEFTTPFDAMMALRETATIRDPVTIEIRWVNVPSGTQLPTTGTKLP